MEDRTIKEQEELYSCKDFSICSDGTLCQSRGKEKPLMSIIYELALDYKHKERELDKCKRYNKILENCLDTKDELCKVLRDKNDDLMNKNELYLEKIRKLEGEENE